MKPEPISAAMINEAARLLDDRPNGLTRADLRRYFGSDRYGRAVMAAVAEAGAAPVIVTYSVFHGERVYRKALSKAELDAEIRTLQSRVTKLQARIDGLELAWSGKGVKQGRSCECLRRVDQEWRWSLSPGHGAR